MESFKVIHHEQMHYELEFQHPDIFQQKSRNPNWDGDFFDLKELKLEKCAMNAVWLTIPAAGCVIFK